MREKRKFERKSYEITTVIKRQLPDNQISIMEFKSSNLSLGGIFISVEDLSLFELGEQVEILVDDKNTKYYEGKAEIVRSARIFTEKEKTQTESGFGLMFIESTKDFKNMLTRKLSEPQSIIV